MSAQSMHALQVANQIRSANAETCQQVRRLPRPAAHALAAEILEHPTTKELALPTHRLLKAIPGLGPAAVDRLAMRAGISLSAKRIRELTDRQRHALAAELRLRGERVT